MAPSKDEINFRRLLGKCEKMVSDAQKEDGKFEWRIEKYIEALGQQLNNIGKATSKPNDEILREYKRKVDFLQGVVKTEKLPSSLSKVRACQQLIPATAHFIDHSKHPTGHGDRDISKDIHLLSKGRYQKEMRKELLGSDDAKFGIGLKNRRARFSDEELTKDSIDDIIKHHHDMQEKVAEEMIKMAQSMKHTSIAASNIIKADKETLTKATKLADSNFHKLKKESNRLEEMNSRRCSWWLWIMLTIVCIVFIQMIFFIKFFPVRMKQ